MEEEMITHSSILAWRIPWTEEPDRQATVQEVAKNRTWLKWLTDWDFKEMDIFNSLSFTASPDKEYKISFY